VGGHGLGVFKRTAVVEVNGDARRVLSLLADESMHGYELMKRLEERSGGIYRASAGTIYPTLQQLEDEGQIVSESVNGKRVYKLIEAGRRELTERDETVRQIWRRARRWEDWRGALDPDTAEIRGPAERLVKAAFRAVAGEQATQRIERVREILLRALRDLEGLGGKGAN
jgi:DNA-binding PadR family transcriptional regulator